MLEKHADFLRDFRGDTIHPSTLDIMHELGLLDDFLRGPTRSVHELAGASAARNGRRFLGSCRRAASSRLHAAMGLPELPRRASDALPAPFILRMEPSVDGAARGGRRVVGVRADAPGPSRSGPNSSSAPTDALHGARRRGLEVVDLGAPIDVLWMRVAQGGRSERTSATSRPGASWH